MAKTEAIRDQAVSLDPTVRALGVVSLLNAFSSEVAVRTLPLFLVNVLGVRISNSGQVDRIPLKLIAAARDDSLVVPASFLLFDFKQNLRQWPNVAGDISRSPPVCAPSKTPSL
jgi:hypothetical protein